MANEGSALFVYFLALAFLVCTFLGFVPSITALDFILICFGFTASALGRVRVRTPLSKTASALSVFTGTGI